MMKTSLAALYALSSSQTCDVDNAPNQQEPEWNADARANLDISSVR